MKAMTRIIGGCNVFISLTLAVLSVPINAETVSARRVFHALDSLNESLNKGGEISKQKVLDEFRADENGMIIDHGYYGLLKDGTRQKSDIIEYHVFGTGKNGAPDIAKMTIETIDKSTILRLNIAYRNNPCLNAKDVIARYDLKYSPPPGPSPGALAVVFARQYKYGNFSIVVPVNPSNQPSAMVGPSSCVSNVRIFVDNRQGTD